MKGILLDENGNFLLSGGLIQVGEADGQTIENILKANRGEFKESPLIGGEILKNQNGQPSQMWSAMVKKQIKSFGIKVKTVNFTETEITVTQ